MILTNKPTPRSTVHEQLKGSWLGMKFSTFYGRWNDTARGKPKSRRKPTKPIRVPVCPVTQNSV
jgi:hypothetical protein